LAVATKFPESPKSSGKNPCLSGFQVGQPLGNVKTAEVRKKEKKHFSFCTFLTYSYFDLRSKVLSFEKAKKILLFTHLFVPLSAE